ncbi:MAG: hypothetical protein ACI9JL_002407 [Paracoccaceae bacterium]|jgi:hypothetical protein
MHMQQFYLKQLISVDSRARPVYAGFRIFLKASQQEPAEAL